MIDRSTFAEMHAPQSIITPAGPIATLARLSRSTHFWAYGLGWRMNDYRGRKVLWHTGGIAGFLAYVGLVPEEGLGMVILSNGDLGYEMLPQALAYTIVDRYVPALVAPLATSPSTDWSSELAAAMRRDREAAAEVERRLGASRVKGTQPPLPLAAYAGSYANPIYGEARLSLADGGLTFRLRDGAAGTVEHWHYDLFRLWLDATWRAGWFVTFGIGAEGKVERMTVQGLGDFTAARGT